VFRRRRAARGAAPSAVGQDEGVPAAVPAFWRCLEHVEASKAALAAAAPGRRSEGVALAEALAAFETGLREAERLMPGWRMSWTEESWQMCRSALQESLASAEALRLGTPPEGYEQLYATLGDLMEPLDAFALALERLRDPRA
jgi:hypothetical protein